MVTIMKYKIGRNNLAATIYVPYDCQNNCAFCTSKQEYSKCKMNKEAVIAALKKLVKNPHIKDIVFTGGEPTANISLLNEMVKIAQYKNVYINTTLPSNNFFGALEVFNDGDVKGVNISRHFPSFAQDSKAFHAIVDDWAIKGIDIPVKINVVLNEKTTVQDVEACIQRWSDFPNVTVCFRRDFRKTTMENLHTMSGDYILDYLVENYTYEGHSFCDVCDTVHFAERIAFHRGMEHSSFKVGNTVVVNDIIVFPDGFIAYDWDKKPITDLDGFLAEPSTTAPRRESARKPQPAVYDERVTRRDTSPHSSCGVSYPSSCGVSYARCGAIGHC